MAGMDRREASCADAQLVSIVVPAYNAEPFIAEALESALRQTYPHTEILVVDDGSTDKTLEITRHYEARHPDRIRVLTQQNSGACAARNRGLGAARGSWIKFLDADDVLTDDALTVQLLRCQNQPGDSKSIPYGDAVPCDENLTPKVRPSVERIGIDYDYEDQIVFLLRRNIQTSQPLYPRVLLESVGGFDERLMRAQEYDLHLRLAVAGARFVPTCRDGVLLRNHSRPDRISMNHPVLHHGELYLASKIARRKMLEEALGAPLSPDVRKPLAVSLWRNGRRVAETGKTETAQKFFAEARILDPAGRWIEPGPYRMLSQILGPVGAARIAYRTRATYDKVAKMIRRVYLDSSSPLKS